MNPLDTITGFINNFNKLPAKTRIGIAAAGLVSLLLVGVFAYLTNQADYQVLFSGLTNEDASAVVAKLQEKKVPYKVSPRGDAVYAPADRIPELRMEMAASGVIRGGIVGYEIFDNKSLGATEFEQQVNLRRALQGELARTINGMDEVEQSRVHIAFPRDTLFADQQKKVTASVTIKLKGGRTLREGQVDGITQLVAKSVEGLSPDDVIVVDTKGNILSRNPGDAKTAHLSNTQAEYRRNIERETAAQVQSLLENVVGKGKAVVRVAADLDFRVTEKTEETYDPESPVVRSSQRQTEKTSSSAPGAKGPAGGQEREKVDEVVNYEINRVVNKTVMPVGEIRKLSIAVLVDGIYTKDDKGKEVYQERSKKELESLEELVRKSAGFNAARGDQVVVTSMPFTKMEADAALTGGGWQEALRSALPFVKYVFIVAAFVVVLLWVVRPLVRAVAAVPTTYVAPAAGMGTASMTAPSLPGGEGVPLVGAPAEKAPQTEAEIVRQLAAADAKRFAEILRNWVR